MKNMGNLLKQAQKLQADLIKKQEELAQKTVEASSGGGAVKVTVNGKQEIVSLKIHPEVLSSPDKEMLEDLVLAACNEGLKKSKELMAEELSRLSGGLPLPPGLF
jgi:DNA-binding YbaB/EbfC family protein